MNKQIKSFTAALLLLIFVVGCTTDEVVDNPILLTSGIAKVGQALSTDDKLYKVGDTIVYKFEVTSPNGIEKIEFSGYEGVGVNKKAPVVLRKIENPTGTTWTLVDTIKNIQNDVRYSLYVQDRNRQYKTIQVNAFLDITRYLDNPVYPYPSPLISLKDGLSNGTSKTFLNIESGRSFYVANTIGDPAGIDIGFAYLENQSTIKACLVSFNEYWRTGNYSSIVNNLNNGVVFRKSTNATTNTGIKVKYKNAESLKYLFETSVKFPSTTLFPDEKAAINLVDNNVIAFKTNDNRYGVIQIFKVNRRSETTQNTQDVSFYMIVEKNKSVID